MGIFIDFRGFIRGFPHGYRGYFCTTWLGFSSVPTRLHSEVANVYFKPWDHVDSHGLSRDSHGIFSRAH